MRRGELFELIIRMAIETTSVSCAFFLLDIQLRFGIFDLP